MSENVRPECISEIATILAKGFLRFQRSRRLRLADPPQNGLASGAEPSPYMNVVNAERTDGD